MSRTLRLLVAEDEPVVRSGLRLLLDAQPDLEVVGEAGDGREAVLVARTLHPDLVLMDIRMPVLDGIGATREIAAMPEPAPRVLVLTTFATDEHLLGALHAGASGVVLKRADPAEIADAVRTVWRGGSLVLPAATRRLLAEPPAEPGHAAAFARLTPRERDVLRLMAAGMSNGEIGDELFLGGQTVKSHVAGVLAKLRVRDRTQAVVVAYRGGFVG